MRLLCQIVSISPFISLIFLVLYDFHVLQLLIEVIISKQKEIFDKMKKTQKIVTDLLI